MGVRTGIRIVYARDGGGIPVAPCVLPAVTIVGSAAALVGVVLWPGMGAAPRVLAAAMLAWPLIVALRAGFRSELRGWRYAVWAILVVCATCSLVLAAFVLAVVHESRITGPL